MKNSANQDKAILDYFKLQKELQNQSPETGMLKAFGLNALNSGTFGAAPHVRAGISALTGDNYENELEKIRQAEDYYSKNYPLSSIAGNVGGALVSPNIIGKIEALVKAGKIAPKVAEEALSYLAKSRTAEAATSGALEGALTNDENRTAGAIQGGLTGAAFEKATTYGRKLLNIFPGLKKEMVHTKQAEANIKEPETLIEETESIGGIPTHESEIYIDPEAGRYAKLSEEYEVPLTKGQLTGDTQTILKEEAAKLGKFGPTFENEAKALENLQNSKISAATKSLRTKLAGGVESEKKGENVRAPLEEIKTKANKERELHTNIYKEVENTPSSIDKSFFEGFDQDFINKIEKRGFKEDIETAKPVRQELKRLSNIINNEGDLGLNDLIKYRQDLNQKIAGTTGADQKLLIELKNDLTDKLTDLTDYDILSGKNAFADYKKANELKRIWHDKYMPDKNDKNPAKKFMAEFLDDKGANYTDEMLVNKIFGAAKNGFGPQSATIVRELKKHMSPEGQNALKAEFLYRLTEPLREGHVDRFRSAFKDLLQNNKSLALEMLSKQDIKGLNDLGDIARRVKIKPFSGVNPSGSGFFGNFLDTLGKLPVPGAEKAAEAAKFVANRLAGDIEFREGQLNALRNKGIKIPRNLDAIERAIYLGGSKTAIDSYAKYERDKERKKLQSD